MDTHEHIVTETQTLLEKLHITPESVVVRTDALHPIVSIHTKDSQLLIGTRGETLRALNHILKKIVEQSDTNVADFVVDVNDYQLRQLQTLERHTHILTERARAFKRSVECKPMNAYERMVVHALCGKDPDIETESIGEGVDRRVVIKYAGR